MSGSSVLCARARGFRLVIGLAAAIGAPAAARAADGVLEINQACATGSGCFASDAAGFPVRITGAAGSSYRLTSDLVLVAPNATAIELVGEPRGVTIDLGGFAIRGPATCSGSPLSCANAITGFGITRASDSTASAIAIRNGSIVGMGGGGVRLGATDDCVVEDLEARENGQSGVIVGASAIVRGVTATRNGASGIITGDGALVASSAARGNAAAGISVGNASLVVASVSAANGGDGIDAGLGAALVASTASRNGANGVVPFNGSLVLASTVVGNGLVAIGSFAIFCGQGCRSHGNAIRDNLGTGIFGFFESSYSGNAVTDNSVAPVAGGPPTERGGNLCAGPGVVSATCP